MMVSHDTTIPLYMQVYHSILASIERGEYTNGDKLPAQERLAEIFGVSMVTVRKALEQLTADEIIMTKHGTGSFVTWTASPQQIFAGGSFTETCKRMGCVPETRVVFKALQPASRQVATYLGITAGEEILCIRRLRLMNGKECILENDYFTRDYMFLLDEAMENRSLLDILYARFGDGVFYFDDFFDIAFASAEQASLLSCIASIPLIRVSEIVRNSKGQVVYFNEQYVRSDRYKYAVTSTNEIKISE